MAQSAISFSLLVSKYSFHIIDFDIGFEINGCQPEILVSNLNEQFRTALDHRFKVVHTLSLGFHLETINVVAKQSLNWILTFKALYDVL